jgi:uncharacterized integral membrane protein (TIGR00697 family)
MSNNQVSDRLLLGKDKIQFKYFFILLSLFTATWITSDIAAVKLVSVFGITLTGGFIIFPFTTMLGSIIVEVYGYKNARQAIWAGCILNLTFVFFIYIVYMIPSSSHWDFNEQFKKILVPGMRIAAASVISFIIAEFLNSYMMAKMKIRSKGKSLVKRIIVSCCFSFLLDITLFLFLAFYGTMSNSLLMALIFFAYLKKILCQFMLFPIVCYMVSFLKKLEGVDIFDYNTKFSPFSFDNIYELNSAELKFNKKVIANNEIINNVPS